MKSCPMLTCPSHGKDATCLRSKCPESQKILERIANSVKRSSKTKKGVGNAHSSNIAIPVADMESVNRHEPLGKKESKGLDKKYSVHVHSRTRRLADSDGRSIKALVDGLAKAGIFTDDSPEYVQKTSQSQETTDGDEETIVDIYYGEVD